MTVRAAAIRLMGRTHRAVYRASGGRVLGRVAGMPVLFLTTTGRRSGKRRTTPLTYFVDADCLVVIASNGGEDTAPAWWLNLSSDPKATVTVDGVSRPVVARSATDAEHASLWPTIVATYPGYAAYARRTKRPIPVVLLCEPGAR